MDEATFREKMLAAMAARKLSVAAVSRGAGVTYDVVRDLKRRDGAATSVENARAIGAFLGFSVDTLSDTTGTDDRERELVAIFRELAGTPFQDKMLQDAQFYKASRTPEPPSEDGQPDQG